MPLPPGTRLGPYEITGPLGAGGMGEVYVQEASGRGAKWTISVDGGTTPVWSRDGRQVFYHNGDDMMSVSLATGAAFKPSPPKRLFTGPYEWGDFEKSYFGGSFDVAPDGAGFLIIQRAPDIPSGELRIVLNWDEELKRLVPAEKN